MSEPIEAAKKLLAANGYTVLRTKSYLAAQRRQGVAEAQRAWAESVAESVRGWAENCLDNDRRIQERLTHVWGVAKAHGATDEELAHDLITREARPR